MENCKIHPRVTQRHPELREEDVLTAWNNMIELALRESDEADYWVAVGADAHGRLIEMVAVKDEESNLVIFHAMTPPSKKTLVELKLIRR